MGEAPIDAADRTTPKAVTGLVELEAATA